MSNRAYPIPARSTASSKAAAQGARTRSAARRQSQRDSQAVVVASLSLLATGIALYDLFLLAVGMQ